MLYRVRKIKSKIEPYLFISPAFLLLLVIIAYPIYYVVQLSFFKWDLMTSPSFIGLKNYISFLMKPTTGRVMKATFIYWIGNVSITLILGFALALALNQKIRFRGFFRATSLVSWTLTAVVAGVTWRWMFAPQVGFLTYWVESLLGITPDFLINPNYALLLVIVVDAWRSFGYATIFILAGLQGIDKNILEAAKVDGVSTWGEFRYITLPLLSPSILVLLILLSMRALNMIDIIMVVTKGGPMRLTETLAFNMYQESLRYYNIGYGSAVGVFLLLINVVLAIFYFKLLKLDTGE